MYRTFPSREALKHEKKCAESAAIINSEVPGVIENDSECNISSVTSLIKVLVERLEIETNISVSKRRAAQEV